MFGKPKYLVLDAVFPVVGGREFIPDNNQEALWWMYDGTKSYLITIVTPPAMQPLKLIIPPTLKRRQVK